MIPFENIITRESMITHGHIGVEGTDQEWTTYVRGFLGRQCHRLSINLSVYLTR